MARGTVSPIPFQETPLMPDSYGRTARDKVARTYGIGIVVFIAIFGSLSLFAVFLAHLK
jgi:hypothetical protein